MEMKVLGIIPAHMGSTRFPGKPLATINGKPMIQWVYERAKRTLLHVVVATDSPEIIGAVQQFGGEYIHTPGEYRNGTERCYDAWEWYDKNKEFTHVINIQCDEPMIHPTMIDKVVDSLEIGYEIATIGREMESIEFGDENTVKVMTYYPGNHVSYFARSIAGGHPEFVKSVYTHIGIYGYSVKALKTYATLPPTFDEIWQGLEQYRLLDNLLMHLSLTERKCYGVNTPKDIKLVEKYLKQ